MKRSRLLAGLITSTAILISASANAAIVVTTGGTADPSSGFVSSFAPTTYNFDAVGGTFPTFVPAGQVTFQTGDGSGFSAPSGDTTQYASVGTNPTPGSASLSSVPVGVQYVGLYWSSIDVYNTLTITDSAGDHVINTAGYGALTPGGTVSSYVNIFDTLDITGISFSSTNKAFEFDNLTLAGAVPEVSSWAMMILGFLGLGFFGYRKSSKGSGSAFRFA